jgi:5-methylcytosine-specific restriction endonuclease McrA
MQYRRFMFEPFPQIAEAAQLLDSAADAHLAGDFDYAARLILAADIPEIAIWTEALQGMSVAAHVGNAPAMVADNKRFRPRNPESALQRQIIERDGYHCRFCGIPVIRPKVRSHLKKCYENRIHRDPLRWGPKSTDCHAAFQAMWLVFDHLVPWCRGGATTLENMVVACQPCDRGRGEQTLDEVGLLDPRDFPRIASDWDGLERVIGTRKGTVR